MSETPEFEEMEQIPWSALAARNPRPVPLPVLIGGGIVLIAIAGFLLLRLVPGGGSVAAPGGADGPAALPATTVAAPSIPSSAAAAVPDPATVYSEADLMAIAVDDETRLAMMQAEWFVRDFFTVDGDPTTIARLRGILGDDVELPHNAPAGHSYVEWADAYAAYITRPGSYEVEVAYRLLHAADGVDYRRAPVAALRMSLSVGVDGVTTLRDLPSPVDPPTMVFAGADPGRIPVPEEIVAAARRSAPGVEFDAAVGNRLGDGWELPGKLVGPGGNLWPVLVHIADP